MLAEIGFNSGVVLNINKTRTMMALELAVIFIFAYLLWYKLLTLTTYFMAIILLTILLVIQILRNRPGKFLIFQIAIVFLLIRNTYYFSTNYSIIPFDDGNWDYGVVKTFIENGSISVIQEPRLLTWYSGWPLLHTLAASLSQISGIDAFHVVLLLPSIIAMVSFIFVYLFVEKIRKSMNIDAGVTSLALLIYATSPDNLFWSMQFVRQNFGILMITIIFYLIYLLTISPRNRSYAVLTIFFVMSLVITHHFTSFTAIAYLFLFSAFLAIGKHLAKSKVGSRIFWSSPNLSTIGIALAAFAFLFIWWNSFGLIVWPTIGSGIKRFIEVLMGIREIEYLPQQAYYPSLLTPSWTLSLLRLRDLLMYFPALLGLFLIITKASKTPTKFFVIYSTLSFGILFFFDNVFFRVELYRLVGLSLPFLALLSATSYTQLEKKLRHNWNILISIAVITILLLSSFIGLWAHNFAPLHLYDPSINSIEVGERNIDYMRVNEFLNQKISIGRFQTIWTDDTNPLIQLLHPTEYNKIRELMPDMHACIRELSLHGDKLVCVFKDLNLYAYYAGTSSPVKSPQDAEVFRYEFRQYLGSNFNLIYNDGKYELWIAKF